MKKYALAAFLVGLFGIAYAADPTGTWTWKTKFGKDSKEIEQTLKLKLDGDKVTGTLSGGRGGRGDTKIEDGKFKTTSFVHRDPRVRDMKFVTKYSGKVSDDAIKEAVSETAGDRREEVEAKRAERKRTELWRSGGI